MSVSTSDRIRVVNADGVHIYWADEHEARELIKRKAVQFIRRGGRLRLLRAVAGVAPFLGGDNRSAGRGTGLDHDRYVGRYETRTNPPRVWAFTKHCYV